MTLAIIVKKCKLAAGTKLVCFEGYWYVFDGKMLTPALGGKIAQKGEKLKGEVPSAWASAVNWLNKPNPADIVEVK